MKISYNWLKQYIEFDWSPEELADRLTMSGLEVEGMERYETIPGGLEGVVVGEVKACTPHPNADKLSVCKVDIGADELLSIVCGAPNVAAGQKVPVATVGTTLHPLSGEPFKIKKAKIRGEESRGMICAEDELGLGAGHDGIIVLDEGTAVGTPGRDVFDVEVDTILEIGLTPNRVDASSHYGVARDVAALLRKKAILPDVHELDPDLVGKNPISITLPEPERCPRYVGVYIAGVTVKESPDWLQHRLKSIGLRPINNIVDITNFVLHELGQPLHAFDADRIRGGAIIVKTLPEDTKFTTLDDQERTMLAGQDLMICDGEGPVAVAGVMGGQNSEVEAGTTNIFLESAYFEPTGIRRTASRLGLKTDASYRFERGVDPNNTAAATIRATKLILELAGGKASMLVDENKADYEAFEITFDIRRANKIMGREFTHEEIADILTALDINVAKGIDDNQLQLHVPQYRVDVRRPQDIMEEILRIYGYNNLELPTHNQLSLNLEKRLDTHGLQERYFDYLAGSGWAEIITNPLVPASTATESTANLINNLSEDMAVMRDNMLQTGLGVIEYNHQRKLFDLQLVEFGKTYSHEGEEFGEQEWIALYITGTKAPAHWDGKTAPSTFFTLARELERLQSWFGFSGDVREMEANDTWAYGLELLRGERVIARYGQVHAAQLQRRDIRGDVYFGMIDWQQVLRLHRKAKVVYRPVPKFPAIRRDISMIVAAGTGFRTIADTIRSCNPKLIRAIGITDVYRGDRIGEGKKSYLLNVTMLDEAKTMTDKTADKLMDRIFAKLENDLGVEIRK